MLINASEVNRFLVIVDRRYIFNRFIVEKLLSAVADVTGIVANTLERNQACCAMFEGSTQNCHTRRRKWIFGKKTSSHPFSASTAVVGSCAGLV